jgi:hypothetical protein
VSQRGDVEGVSVDKGEAAFFFDSDLFPATADVPMSGGRANIGIGILAEARSRLRHLRPAALSDVRGEAGTSTGAGIHVASKPLGGIVTPRQRRTEPLRRGRAVGDAGCLSTW